VLILATNRWYNPEVRRWLSRDPIEYEGGENLYEYVDGNAVNELDPTGLTPEVSECFSRCTDEAIGVPFLGGCFGLLAGQPILKKPRPFGTRCTSLASKLFRSLPDKRFQKQVKFRARPGRPLGTNSVGGLAGRLTPFVGAAAIGSDAGEVAMCTYWCMQGGDSDDFFGDAK